MIRRSSSRGIGRGFGLFVAGAVCGAIATWFFMASHGNDAQPRNVNLQLPRPTATTTTMVPLPPGTPAPPADESVGAADATTARALALPPGLEFRAANPETAPDAAALAPLSDISELSLMIPVAGVTAAQLQDTFTDARSEGRPHDAIDIMAATGTPVFAVADGTVAKFFDSKQGGHTIYQFDPLGGIAYYYAHLDRRAPGLAEGQPVKRGQVIGYVGYSGNANPAGQHLHFAIFRLGPEKLWWRGTPINPYGPLGGR